MPPVTDRQKFVYLIVKVDGNIIHKIKVKTGKLKLKNYVLYRTAVMCG